MNFHNFPSKLRLLNAAVISMTTLLLSPALSAATNCATQGQIPQAECQALVDLYTSTAGATWTDSTTNNWNVTNTPCSWTGVTCSSGTSGTVTQIIRSSQNLSGPLPSTVNALTGLNWIALSSNNLTGSIPTSWPASLAHLALANNNLTGTIPSSLPTNLLTLGLSSNHLTGTIPPLPATLTNLDLSNNAFTGTLPSFASLTGLTSPNLDLGYNALTSAFSPGEEALILSLQANWKDTQTVEPRGISATALSSSQVQVNWTPITYTADGGYYQVKSATTPGGPYTNASSSTTDKTATTYTVTGLSPSTTYYFVVETFTPAHSPQQNALTSVLSTEVRATTQASATFTVTTTTNLVSPLKAQYTVPSIIGTNYDFYITFTLSNGAIWGADLSATNLTFTDTTGTPINPVIVPTFSMVQGGTTTNSSVSYLIYSAAKGGVTPAQVINFDFKVANAPGASGPITLTADLRAAQSANPTTGTVASDTLTAAIPTSAVGTVTPTVGSQFENVGSGAVKATATIQADGATGLTSGNPALPNVGFDYTGGETVIDVPADGIPVAAELFGTNGIVLPTSTGSTGDYMAVIYTIDGQILRNFNMTFTLDNGATFAENPVLGIRDKQGHWTATTTGAGVPKTAMATAGTNRAIFTLNAGQITPNNLNLANNDQVMLLYKLSNLGALATPGQKINMTVDLRTGGVVEVLVNPTRTVTVAQSVKAMSVTPPPVTVTPPPVPVTPPTPTCQLTVTVTTATDTGPGSLRDALNQLCPKGQIEFATTIASPIQLASPLVINQDFTLTGQPGMILSGDSNNDGTGDVRVLEITSGNVILNDLIITKGQARNNNGAGILIDTGATVTLNHCQLLDNQTNVQGGGIQNDGSLIVNNSTFARNAATTGGSINNTGQLTITNSTFANNSATSTGGGINNLGTLVINNSTFANQTGDGLHNVGTLSLTNTIIAKSLPGKDCTNTGTLLVNLNNLIADGSCNPTLTGDPMLGELQENGGNIPTLALLDGSPAIDAGDNATCATIDQRGINRPFDGDHNNDARCDIGAYEYNGYCQVKPVVTTTVENGTGSLRVALMEVCEGGRIILTVGGTFALTTPLTINKNVTIDGTGQTFSITGNTLFTTGKNLEIIGEEMTLDNIATATTNTNPAGKVILTAHTGNLTVKEIKTASDTTTGNAGPGGNVTLTAPLGSIHILGDILTYSESDLADANQAGEVKLTAGTGIDTGAINTSAFAPKGQAGQGGVIHLSTDHGDLVINGFLNSGSIATGTSGLAGNIDLQAPQGNITVHSYLLTGTNGVINIFAGQTFQALGQIPHSLTNTIYSDASITIHHGGHGLIPFIVGSASTNGTTFGITSGGTVIPAGKYLGDYILGPIQILTETQPVPSYLSSPSPKSTLDFGKSTVGTPITLPLQLSNVGSLALAVKLTGITGRDANDFSVLSPSFPITLATGTATQDVSVQCLPSKEGARKANLQLSSNDPQNLTVTYELVCIGMPNKEKPKKPEVTGPAYDSLPAPGQTLQVNRQTDQPTVPLTLKLTMMEVGTAELQISFVGITGPDATDFSLLSPTFPVTIANQGEAVPVTIVCTPTANGLRQATLELRTNDPVQATVSYGLSCPGITLPAETPTAGTSAAGTSAIGPPVASGTTNSGIPTTPPPGTTSTNPVSTDFFLSYHTVTEHSSAGTVIGTFSTLDSNTNDFHNYALHSEGPFVIVGDELRVADGANLDFNTLSSYPILVTSTNANGLSTDKSFTIEVTPVNDTGGEVASVGEATTSTTSASVNMTNHFEGIIRTDLGEIGRQVSIDAPERFQLVGKIHPLTEHLGKVADIITIYHWQPVTGDPLLTGAMTVAKQQLLSEPLELTVFQGTLVGLAGIFDVSLGYQLTEKDSPLLSAPIVTLTVRPNHPPTALHLSANTVAELSPENTVIGHFTTEDSDKQDWFVYGLLDDAGYSFQVVGDKLQTTAYSLRLGSGAEREITVRSVDAAGGFIDQRFTIHVTPVVVKPTAIHLTHQTVLENSPAGTVVGRLVTESRQPGTYRYELLDDAQGRFQLQEDLLVVADGTRLDFEQQTSHTITVRVEDTSTHQTLTSLLTIDVLNQVDVSLVNVKISTPAGRRLQATEAVNATDEVLIELQLIPDSTQIGETVELIAVGQFFQAGQVQMKMLAGEEWQDWDGEVETLRAVIQSLTLHPRQTWRWQGALTAFQGSGPVEFYVGYRRANGEVVYAAEAIKIRMK